MSRRSLGGRDMQTRNGDPIISARRTTQARHLGTTTGKGGLRRQLGGLRGRTHEAEAYEQSRLHLVEIVSAELRVEQA
jgi:hypothetical protein